MRHRIAGHGIKIATLLEEDLSVTDEITAENPAFPPFVPGPERSAHPPGGPFFFQDDLRSAFRRAFTRAPFLISKGFKSRLIQGMR